MDVLITYDVAVGSRLNESKNSEVKEAMKDLGYLESFTWVNEKTQKSEIVWLPNTTLWKQNTVPETAKEDLLAVAEEVGADIERMIALEFTGNWAAIPGKPYKR